MVVDPRIKAVRAGEFTHKQPDVEILKGAAPLRWVVSASSGSGKTNLIVNLILLYLYRMS